MGRERHLGDEEGGTRGDEGEKQSFTWLKRMKGSLFNTSRPDLPPQEGSAADRQSFRSRLRPYLTISVDSTSGLKPEGVTVENSPVGFGLNSHWSTSPGAHHVANVAPPRQIPDPPAFPSHPKPRQNASVPTDVMSSYDDTTLLIPKQTQATKSTPLAVPLHHAFERPIPPWTPRSPSVSPFESPIYQTQVPVPRFNSNLVPPRDWHRRSSSAPTAAFKYAGHRDASTPGTRTLMTTNSRKSTNVVPVDPFATPFDDDARVTNHHDKPFVRDDDENPFAPIVM